MADQDLTIKIQATTNELQDAIEAINDVFKKSSDMAKALSETVNSDVSGSLKAASADSAALGASLEAAFSPLAIVGFVSAVVDAGEKISKFISDTFIYTDAEKQADAQLKSENKTLADLAEKTKQVRRERELLNAATASEKDKIKLKFQIEDDGGTAEQFKKKIADTVAEINRLRPESLKTEMTDLYDAAGNQTEKLTAFAQDAKAKMDQLGGTLTLLQDKQNHAAEQEAEAAEQLARHQAAEAERAKAEEERQRQQALAAFQRAQQKQMQSFMEGLQKKKDALDAFHSMSKQDEAKYWDEILVNNKVVGQNLEQILHLRTEASKEADRQSLHDEVESVEAQVTAAKAGSQQRVQILNDELAKMLANQQDQTAEYKRLLKERDQAVQDAAKKELKDEVDQVQEKAKATKAGSQERISILEAEIEKLQKENKADTEEYKRLVGEKTQAIKDFEKAAEEAQNERLKSEQQHAQAINNLERSRLDFERQIGQVSEGEYEARLKAQINATYAAALRELEIERDRYQKGTKDYEKYQAEITKLTDKHTADIEKLEQQSYQRRRQMFDQYYKQITAGFNTALNSWMQGTESASQAFGKMFENILSQLINFVEQWIEKKIEMWLMDKLISQTTQSAAAMAEITSNAAVAYSAAYASTAAIPFVGPELAPEAAMAAYMDVMAMTPAGFALGGIVPATGLALVHQGERVLPASMSGNGDLGMGNVHVHLNVNAIDSNSFQNTITRHGNMIGNEVMRVLKKRGITSK